MCSQKWNEDYMLIQESLNGNKSAWSSLYKEAYPLVYNYVRKKSLNGYIRDNIIDDVVNESFLRCYEKRAFFEKRSKFSTWVCGFANYVFLEYIRIYKICFVHNYNIKYFLPSVYDMSLPEQIVIKREQYKCLYIAFSTLPLHQRLLIMCYTLNDIRPKKVIALTNISKYSDRMLELQLALDAVRRYYLFLYEGKQQM